MEYFDGRFRVRIAAGEIRSLSVIAPAARPGKIRRIVIASMLASDYVFDMKRLIRIGLFR